MEFTDIVKQKDFSRRNMKPIVEGILDSIKNGEVNALEAWIQVKSLADTMEKLIKSSEFKSLAIDEADKFHKDDMYLLGVKFELRNSSVSTKTEIDFTQDAEWVELKELEQAAIANRKGRETKLNQLFKEGLTKDPVTGEELNITTKTTTSSSSRQLVVRL